MTRRIRVTAIYNQQPNIRLYVLALIELARQLQEEEEQAAREQLAEPGVGEDATDD